MSQDSTLASQNINTSHSSMGKTATKILEIDTSLRSRGLGTRLGRHLVYRIDQYSLYNYHVVERDKVDRAKHGILDVTKECEVSRVVDRETKQDRGRETAIKECENRELDDTTATTKILSHTDNHRLGRGISFAETLYQRRALMLLLLASLSRSSS